MANDIKSVVLATTNKQLEAMLEKEGQALPKNFNTLRFKQEVMTVLSDNPDLMKLKGQEFNLCRAIMKGAYQGLSFANKECYIITYGGVPQYMTDYKGEVKLALNYAAREVKNIYAQLVKEGEDFTVVTDGEDKKVIHKQGISNKEIVGAYAVVVYMDGSTNVEIMTKEEIDTIRNKFSKQSRGKAWSDSYGEMAKKTVLRRLTKHIQLNFETVQQREVWENESDVSFKPEVKEKSIFEEETVIEADFTETPLGGE